MPGSSAASLQPVPAYLKDYEELYARDPRKAALQWFADAKFGMLIHYGLASLDGIHPFEQWYCKIPVNEFEKKAGRFTADGFDADATAGLAQKTGMRYITMVTKHCHGFCLWDTKETGFSSLKAASRRDLVKEMAEACRKRGLGFFVFYEHGFEWHHPHAPRVKDWKCRLTEVPYPEPDPAYAHGDQYDMNKYVDFVSAQITELLTQYGPVAGVWLDGYAVPMSGDRSKFRLPELYDQIHRLQPQALISYKLGVTGTEDFLAPEISWFVNEVEQEGDVVDTSGVSSRISKARKAGQPVEVCDTMAPRWFYMKNEKLRSGEYVLRNLKMARSLGINYLLNIGLMPDGSINPQEAEILNAVGATIRASNLLADQPD